VKSYGLEPEFDVLSEYELRNCLRVVREVLKGFEKLFGRKNFPYIFVFSLLGSETKGWNLY
jgi:hypothetical protein